MRGFDTAAYDCLDAARELDRFGITLDAEATKWLTKLRELRAHPPEETSANRVGELIADSASATVIDKALARQVSQNIRSGQHRHAQQLCGRRMLDALITDNDRLHQELAAIADEIIERLHAAAVLDEDIVTLTRARRTDEAHLLAVAESDAAELDDLYKLRDRSLTPAEAKWSTGWWTCERWSNPWDIGHVAENDGTRWGTLRATIRAGGRLWFVPHEVATAASQEHEPHGMTKPIDPRRSGSVFAG